MPGPYDSVVSIGGQSFVDGLWRIFGPALEGVTNPLPVAIPGFANGQMRITQIEPLVPGAATAGGALHLLTMVEVAAEALLHVTTSTDSVNIALGQPNFTIDTLTGALNLPAESGTLSNLKFVGSAVNLGTGSGAVDLPAGAAQLSNVAGTGKISLPNNLNVPGIPLPAVIPVPVDLTPKNALQVPATIVLTVNGPSPATRFGLRFQVSSVTIGPIAGIDPGLATSATAKLQSAIDQVVSQLAIPGAIAQPVVDQNAIAALVAAVPKIVGEAVDEALTQLLAETGRLVFPPAGTGASCDVKALPTLADAQLTATADGSYLLQVGFKRAGSADIPAFPAFAPGAIDCSVLVGNSVVLELLCCLVERLPAFSLPAAATTGTTDVAGGTHVRCCNFTGVTANFGPLSIGGGGISVCVDGTSPKPKTFSLIGSFTQGVPSTLPLVGTVATVAVGFTLPVMFDLDDASSIANLRFMGTPTVTTSVSPNITALIVGGIVSAILGLLSFTIGGGLVGAIAGAILGLLMPIALVIVILLLIIACDAANYLLNNAVRTVLQGASLLRSPVAIPPGLFEAFGRLSPVSVAVDDLTANSVLHTPTSPWAVLPRIGPREFPRPPRPPKPPIGSKDNGEPTPTPRGKGRSGTARPTRRASRS